MATLALHDILAVQIEYGVNWTTRSGDTVYGYNETTGLGSYDLTARDDIAFSIWDGGGTDTLDFSGSNAATELDLRDGSFSSVNGQTYNVSIAYGAIVENGIGNVHDDVIRGNGVANVLEGGAGNDLLIGSTGTAYSEANISGQVFDLTETLGTKMTATQSSTWADNESRYGAAKVIDDDLSTFNHTSSRARWLNLDLSDSYSITELKLHNRSGYESRLDDAVVTLRDAQDGILHSFDPITSAGAIVTLTLPTAVQAHTVRIEDSRGHLHLTELDVFGSYANAAQYDGTDTLLGGAAADTLGGGEGIDTLDLSEAESGIWVSLDYVGAEIWTRDSADMQNGEWRAVGELTEIENITASRFPIG